MMQTPAVYLPNGSPNRKRLQALIAISAAVAMATIDTAITNTALPTIAGDIGSDGASAIWIINAYQLVMVAAGKDNRETVKRGYKALVAGRDNVSVLLNKVRDHAPKWMDGEL